MKYYLTNRTGPGDGHIGPFELNEVEAKLESGELSRSDLCWKEGLPEWQLLSQMQEFASLAVAPPALPPPLAITPNESPVVVQRASRILTCPHCHSDQVKSFRVLFQAGTHQSQTNSTGVIWAGGRPGVVQARSHSTSMSLLAQQTAPPMRKVTYIYLYGWSLFFVPLIFIAPFVHYSQSRWNKTVYPKLYAEWERSWHCLTCGNSFLS